MRLRLALLTLVLATPAVAQPADMVLRGGRVITVDGDWHVAQAVAIKDGRFVAVGDVPTPSDERVVAMCRCPEWPQAVSGYR